MGLPRKVKTGDPVKAAEWNALIDYLRSVQLQPSASVRVTRLSSGTTLAAVPLLAKAGGSVPTHPWQPFAAPPPTEGEPPPDQNFKFKLEPGLVFGPTGGQMMPSNRNLVIDVPPSSEDGYFVWLKVTLDQQENTLASVIYEHGTVPPQTQNPSDGALPSTVYLPLLYFISDEDGVTAIKQLVNCSVALQIVVINYDGLTLRRALAWNGVGAFFYN